MNEIKVIGIVGSGRMGSDLFNYLSDFNFQLIWFTRNSEHREILKNTYQKKINRQLKHGIITRGVFDFRKKYSITTNLDDLVNCDLIIESIIEDAETKLELFKKLDKIVRPSCLLASNTSSVLPSELSEITTKSRVLGLHFFYPIAFKNIVEIIIPEFADEISIEKAKMFLSEIKKFYLEQNEQSAYILNRFILQLQVVAFDLLETYNIDYEQFDEITKQIIPEFGLFEMMDHVGHNTMYNAIMNYSRMDSDKKKYQPLLNELLSRKKYSTNKTGNLFYNNDNSQKKISQSLEQEIINQIKAVANHYFKEYTETYHLNPFNLKKGLEEFSGIML